MECYPVLAILSCLIHFTVQQRHPDILDCIQDNRTRTFDSLVHYQGTNISFDPKHPGYLGNNVNFSFLSIDRLLKNSFISFGSNSVMKISLDHKKISQIDDGAFSELTCLHDLDLSHNALSELSSGVFEGLPNLARLSLSGNLLRDIPHLPALDHLTFLDLSRNLISITPSYSLPMTLVSLNLGFNRIRTLKNTTLTNLSSLKFLELNDNNLADIEPGSWKNLYYIEDLNLARNSFRSFNTTNNFNFFHLKKLNLSGNHLSTLQVWGMSKNFASLKLLDITKNDWYCEELDMIRHQLKGSNIILQEPINCRTVTTPSPVISTTRKESDLIMDIIAQNGEIMASNKELEKHVKYVESVLVYLFVMVVIYIIVNVSVKTGLCRNLYTRFLERDVAYLDNTDSETGVLVMR